MHGNDEDADRKYILKIKFYISVMPVPNYQDSIKEETFERKPARVECYREKFNLN